MALIPLTLDSVGQLKGGMVSLMVGRDLERMAADIESAPDLAEWRTVTLTIRAKPVYENGELDHVCTEFVVKRKTPDRVTSANMLLQRNPKGERQLAFQELATDNPHQQTFE